MLTSGIQLVITSHHEETFNVVKLVELHHIPRSLCHGSMTQVVVAYPDDSCLHLKGMHNSREMAEFFQDWGQSSQFSILEKEATREECNVILQYGDNTSSTSSDEGLTTLECETLRLEAALICPEKKEVNMNLRGGKVLPELQNPHKKF
jgi:hypothetical protein